MTKVFTMTEKAALLILCDNRAPLPSMDEVAAGKTLPSDSVVALPLKRDVLRRSAREHDVEIQGEVIIELEKDSDMEWVLNSAMKKLSQYDIDLVISVDREGLEDACLFQPLAQRITEQGLEFVDVASS